jgi:hypothetical protein
MAGAPDRMAGLVRLAGDVRVPGFVSAADLRLMPHRTAEVSFSCRGPGLRRHHFAGPLLIDVVRAVEPLFDPGERRDRLRFLLSIRGRDGHRAVLSWGEIDPEFGAVSALLGVWMDGRDLGADAPHLVVPGDRCGSRHVSRVAEIRVWADDRLWAT